MQIKLNQLAQLQLTSACRKSCFTSILMIEAAAILNITMTDIFKNVDCRQSWKFQHRILFTFCQYHFLHRKIHNFAQMSQSYPLNLTFDLFIAYFILAKLVKELYIWFTFIHQFNNLKRIESPGIQLHFYPPPFFKLTLKQCPHDTFYPYLAVCLEIATHLNFLDCIFGQALHQLITFTLVPNLCGLLSG